MKKEKDPQQPYQYTNDMDDWNNVHEQLQHVQKKSDIQRKAENENESVAGLTTKELTVPADTNPYGIIRYQGGYYRLSEKFGSDFKTMFLAGYLNQGLGATPSTIFGQMGLTDKIDGFDFTSLTNAYANDPYPATLDLQSVITWRIDPSGKYISKSYMKRDFIPEPSDKKTLVDNPGFREEDPVHLVSVADLGASKDASVRYIVRLVIVEEQPEKPVTMA